MKMTETLAVVPNGGFETALLIAVILCLCTYVFYLKCINASLKIQQQQQNLRQHIPYPSTAEVTVEQIEFFKPSRKQIISFSINSDIVLQLDKKCVVDNIKVSRASLLRSLIDDFLITDRRRS